MRIILLQDIKGVGKRHGTKEVADGYARNFLFPKKLARPATPVLLKELKTHEAKNAALVKHLQALSERLKERSLTFYLKTDEKGSIFGSVTKEMILKGLRDAKLVTKERVSIKLAYPLKSFGAHEVEADLTHGIISKLKIVVHPKINEPTI